MQKVGKFKITDSFKLTGRGLVVIGDIIEGRVKIGDIISFDTGIQRVMKKISGVEMGDKRSTREYFVGLTFVSKSEEEMKSLELLRLRPQIVGIWDASDWRLTGQESYLFGVTFFFRNYSDRTTSTDHDHCEFCMNKFSDSIPGTLSKGYTTADGYRWICESCFADFKEAFEWTN